MKWIEIKQYLFLCLLISFIAIGATGCADRNKTPAYTGNGTIVYSAKEDGGVEANITLFRHNPSHSDELVGEGSVFTIMEDENINAFIELKNCFSENNRDLIFHVDWVTEEGRSFYRKQFNSCINDSCGLLKSAISLSPNKREAGNYYVRCYLFRELIAEKRFEIKPEFFIDRDSNNSVKVEIILYRGISKKTGKMVGEGSQFQIKKKRKIRAAINIENCPVYENRELIFDVVWLDNKGNAIYHKNVNMAPGEVADVLKSSISIAPDHREPGEYALMVTLYGKQIARKYFTILPVE